MRRILPLLLPLIRPSIRPLILPLILAMPAAGAGATDLPGYPFVSTGGKAQIWLQPDIAELRFDTGAQHASAETAAAAIGELGAALAALLAENGVAESDIDNGEVTKKTVKLTNPAADGATEAWTLERRYRVVVRDLARWPDLAAALMARDHVDSLSVSFDRTDKEQVTRELMTQAARDARANGTLLAQSFGRQLGPAVAIARGPLDKVAPAIFEGAGGTPPAAPRPVTASNYRAPPAIPFAQSVNAVFRLK
ncbi:hypothetical protein GCM10007386_57400 [Pseudoduganella dura]|nr:hypothetical protein GCM10007386_57400 [Pseudoduganella dura]